MPVYKCPKGYKIGKTGKCIYKTKMAANKAYIGYKASKNRRK